MQKLLNVHTGRRTIPTKVCAHNKNCNNEADLIISNSTGGCAYFCKEHFKEVMRLKEEGK